MYITRPNLWVAESSMCTKHSDHLVTRRTAERGSSHREALVFTICSANGTIICVLLFSTHWPACSRSKHNKRNSRGFVLAFIVQQMTRDLVWFTNNSVDTSMFSSGFVNIVRFAQELVGVGSVRIRTMPVFTSNAKISCVVRLELNARSSDSTAPEANVVGIRVNSWKGVNLWTASWQSAETIFYV